MTHTTFKAALVFAAIALSQAAHAADKGVYMGARSDRVQLSIDGASLSYGGLRGAVGYQFTPNIAVEAHLGTGVTDAKIGGATSQLGAYYGADLVGKLPFGNGFALLGKVGFGSIEIDGITDSDIRYGAGASYNISSNADVSISYERWFAKEGVTIDSINAGVNYRF